MSIKERIDNHPVVFYLSALLSGFLAYPFIFLMIIGKETISSQDLAELKDKVQASCLECRQENDVLMSRISDLQNTNSRIGTALLANTQSSPLAITSISLTPPSPAILKVGQEVIVNFSYVIPEPIGMAIYAYGFRGAESVGTFAPSAQHSGKGQTQRAIRLDTPGQIDTIFIAVAPNGQNSAAYQVTIPVDYKYH